MFNPVDVGVDDLDSPADIADVHFTVIFLGDFTGPRNDTRPVFGRMDSQASVRHKHMPLAATPDDLVYLHFVPLPSY
jgi:hypothetical protein